MKEIKTAKQFATKGVKTAEKASRTTIKTTRNAENGKTGLIRPNPVILSTLIGIIRALPGIRTDLQIMSASLRRLLTIRFTPLRATPAISAPSDFTLSDTMRYLGLECQSTNNSTGIELGLCPIQYRLFLDIHCRYIPTSTALFR